MLKVQYQHNKQCPLSVKPEGHFSFLTYFLIKKHQHETDHYTIRHLAENTERPEHKAQ
jgi:hypothetical protein